MLDRESTFANDEVFKLLREKFVPVAIDVFYHERRKDAEGEFYRKVVNQRDGMRPDRTTQGFYIFTPDGSLIVGWNNRDPKKVARHLRNALKKQHDLRADEIELEEDKRYARTPPKDGLIVDVYSKVLDAKFATDPTDWTRILRSSTGRDHLWVTKSEARKLAVGAWPPALTRRIARHHLIDNTRGEPPMWRSKDVKTDKWALRRDKGFHRLTGTASAASADGKRGYDMTVAGRIRARGGKVRTFDVIARGEYWGGGKYTSNDLPNGRFAFAVAFRIAADDAWAKTPPQGSRDLHDYLRAK